ncbi:MAG: aminotransferase class IV [Verrucomicrobia bacterium]|nr:aminotransferase class IV [Verrucomicrobiota bacterium]
MKTVYFNGQFVSEGEARVSILDRGFLYGDGLFETLRCYRGKPFRWDQHWKRLEHGASVLQIRLPLSSAEAKTCALQLLKENGVEDAILRINLSRGVGTRGYSTKNACSPVLAMTLHDAPKHSEAPIRWRLKTSELRVLKNDPLARIKSANKLLHVLAKSEAEQGRSDEALLLNSANEIAEATSGNFFWIEKENVFTPPVNAGILPGITRSVIFELCQKAGVSCMERTADLDTVKKADASFLTLSSLEIVEVEMLDEQRFSSSKVILKLLQGYRDLVALETENC